jgi:flavin-dependent dehydrogenase
LIRPFAGRTGYLRRASGPGWALVGDAGFFRDPFTAHGITDALLGAALLARAILDDDLARYEPERDEHAIPMLEVTDAIASFAWTLDELMELHRRLQTVMAQELDLVRRLAAPPRLPSYGAYVATSR